MKVHLSVDDVISSFMSIAQSKPKSVFDVPFFNCLNKFHVDYGAKFTVYAFMTHYSNGFHITEVPPQYWQEIENAGFLRLGYHGSFHEIDYTNFCVEFDCFCDTVPMSVLTNRLRLHRYSAELDKICFLREHGITELLCRDDETQMQPQCKTQYDLNVDEMRSIADSPFIKNGISYRKTDIKLELFDNESIRSKLECSIKENNDMLVIFTHEKFLPEKASLLDEVLMFLTGYNAEFEF